MDAKHWNQIKNSAIEQKRIAEEMYKVAARLESQADSALKALGNVSARPERVDVSLRLLNRFNKNIQS